MHSTSTKAILVVLALAAAAGAVWGQSSTSIQVRTGPSGVAYLADAKGMTLYYYTKDADGQSACYGNCETAWPVFFAATLTLPSSLNAADFGSVTRTDGSKQTTYHGWPLYYWFKDKDPGEMTGEGVGKVWYVLKVPAYTVMVSTNATLGNYLVDGDGRALYWFTKDSAGQSACSGDCIKNWPAFSASSIVAPSGVNAADFATIARPDGTTQVTYKGYPLYFWVKDQKRGDVTGQNVGKVWFVVDPANFPPKA